jgi:hypothetical protein
MRALTLHDDTRKNPVPWLSLVEYKYKTIETRSNWNFKSFRGDLLLTGSADSRTLNKGLACCVVKVVDIVPMKAEHEKRACIEVYPNAWALITEDLRWLTRKFPVKGFQGVFNIDVPKGVELYEPSEADLLVLPADFQLWLKSASQVQK